MIKKNINNNQELFMSEVESKGYGFGDERDEELEKVTPEGRKNFET